ncbi:MAG: hypothetical protein Tsb0034_12040 [Ekhidna sp.]
MYAILFSLVSFIFGLVQFNVPAVKGITSDLREIPLLISIFHLHHPLYLLIAAVSTWFAAPPDGSELSTYIMHIVGLIGCWYYQKYVVSRLSHKLVVSFSWIVGVGIYYWLLVLPVMIWTNWMLGLNTEVGFYQFYSGLVLNTRFEVTATAVIVAMYAYQRELQKDLKTTIEQLEEKNSQLSEYAFINSHLLRAPLAKIIGFIDLMRTDKSTSNDPELQDNLMNTCQEFDETVKLIGKVVADKSKLSREDLLELENQIRDIAANSHQTLKNQANK